MGRSGSVSVPSNIDSLFDGVEDTPQPEEAQTEEVAEVTESIEIEESQESTPDVPAEEQDEAVYFNDVVESLEDITIEDAYEMSFKMPNDEAITLGKLKNFYIDNKDIEESKAKLDNRELELQAEAEAVRKAPQVSNELMQARAQVLAIQEQYNSTNWDAIRQSNPAEWSALQTEYQNRFQSAKALETEAQNRVDTQSEQQRRLQQDRLFEWMPELKDEKVAADTMQQVSSYASKYGFTQSDIANITDARLFRMLIESSKVNSAIDTVKEKQVKTGGKTSSKPSAPKPSYGKRQKLKQAINKAKNSQHRKDKQAAFDALLS